MTINYETVEFDYSALRGKIREKLGSEGILASLIGMDKATLSKKLNNKSEFTQLDMAKIMDALGEAYSQITRYFFTPKLTVA